ncbi:cupin domain-containing protein [Candidatus Woesearchaeota archaeon]|jgi:mannose-6-phosphate isomerase-like protein (cupin superfamily)|nr:cupin domain-containing protein [Candidatus Woesearchaeota archaeon]
MEPYSTNIEKETIENENYRKVLYTGKMQLVVMSLKPGEDIPEEVHDNIDQFFRIEQGEAYIKVDDEEFNLNDDDIIIIPAGSKHYVKNSSENKVLKVYTIYTPPEHSPETIHKTKEDADNAEHNH